MKSEFSDFCIENYGKYHYDEEKLVTPFELESMLRVLLKKFKKRNKKHHEGQMIETPLEAINQANSRDVGISDLYDKGLETLKFLHEMSGLKSYMEQRITPHYKVKNIESAMKLCLRC